MQPAYFPPTPSAFPPPLLLFSPSSSSLHLPPRILPPSARLLEILKISKAVSCSFCLGPTSHILHFPAAPPGPSVAISGVGLCGLCHIKLPCAIVCFSSFLSLPHLRTAPFPAPSPRFLAAPYCLATLASLAYLRSYPSHACVKPSVVRG